jgi:DNA polymerase-3 subunit alpha
MTRGLLIYREQVREILLDTAGLSERDAAFVERALETKSASDLQSARLEFIRGALEKGIDEQGAQKIFDYLLHNVQYTFDKVYSCTQAYLSYRSAFLKAHHPAEYFCAILDSSGDSRDRKDRYLAYLKSHGPDIFPPDVNFSGTGFITENGAIRAPMAEACDMTEEEAGTVLSEREGGLYGSLDDLLNRLSGKLAMETAVNMAECGLFDSISEGRDEAKAEVLAFYDEHARAGEFFRTRPDGGRTKRADDDQLSLFDD